MQSLANRAGSSESIDVPWILLARMCNWRFRTASDTSTQAKRITTKRIRLFPTLRWPIEIDRIPGTRLDDYSLLLAESLMLATVAWVLFPLWVGLRFCLTETEHGTYRKPRFFISTILLWTSALGGLLGCTQLLTWWAAPSSYLSRYTGTEAIFDFILLRIPSCFLTGTCVLAIAFAWSLHWFQHLALVGCAIFADGMGHHFVYSSLAATFAVPVPTSDAFTSHPLLYWSYILGRGFVAWAGFGVAYRFGLSLVLPPLFANTAPLR